MFGEPFLPGAELPGNSDLSDVEDDPTTRPGLAWRWSDHVEEARHGSSRSRVSDTDTESLSSDMVELPRLGPQGDPLVPERNYRLLHQQWLREVLLVPLMWRYELNRQIGQLLSVRRRRFNSITLDDFCKGLKHEIGPLRAPSWWISFGRPWHMSRGRLPQQRSAVAFDAQGQAPIHLTIFLNNEPSRLSGIGSGELDGAWSILCMFLERRIEAAWHDVWSDFLVNIDLQAHFKRCPVLTVCCFLGTLLKSRDGGLPATGTGALLGKHVAIQGGARWRPPTRA